MGLGAVGGERVAWVPRTSVHPARSEAPVGTTLHWEHVGPIKAERSRDEIPPRNTTGDPREAACGSGAVVELCCVEVGGLEHRLVPLHL